MITFDDCVEIHETVEMEKWRERELQEIYEEALKVACLGFDDEDGRFSIKIFEDYLHRQSLTENEIYEMIDCVYDDKRFEA